MTIGKQKKIGKSGALRMYKNIAITLLILFSMCLYVEVDSLYEAIEVQDETIEYIGNLYEQEKANVKVIIGEPDVYEVANKFYGVDINLLKAIEMHESARYTSDLFLENNNSWGAMCGDGYLAFDSHEQSVMELARTIKYYYLDLGLDTIDKMAVKYCPDDYVNWSNSVKEIYEEVNNMAN